MKNLFIALTAIGFLLSSCNSQPKSEDSNLNTIVSISVDEFMASSDSFNNMDARISGMVTHVCKHGGQKLFLAGTEEGVSLRIETGEDIPEFNVEWEGTEVEFSGKIVLMDEVAVASAEDKHEENSSEEADCDFEKNSEPVEKVYYMVASSYKNL